MGNIAKIVVDGNSFQNAKPEETKTVALDMSSGDQTITPTSGSVLTEVVVEKPATLTAGNIKDGVTIGGVTGSYSGGVDYMALRLNQTEDYSYENNICTSIPRDLFENDGRITSIVLSKITQIPAYCFNSCDKLNSGTFELATQIGSAAFQACTALKNIPSTMFPEVTSVGTYAFYNCYNLETINFPKLTSMSNYSFTASFVNLQSITLGANQVCYMNSTNVFDYYAINNVPVYVPANLIDSYKVATNWSNYYNNGKFIFHPITGTSFNITTSVTNGSYSGATTIVESGTATVTLTASSGYDLPSSITVTGASYTYNSTTGVVSLSSPTGNVSITAVCTQQVSGYTVSVASFGTSPYNMGRAYYSLDDGSTWIQITGAGTLTTSATQIKFKAEDDSAGAMESVEIISSTLGLSIESYGTAVSSNYTLSSNVTDIQVIFNDND